MKPEIRFAIVTASLLVAVGCGSGGDRAASSGEALSAAACASASPWAEGKSYAAGDVVTYGGATYQCIQAHTSEPGWTPDAVASLWSPATCGGGGGGSGSSGGSSGSSGGTCGGSSGGGSSGGSSSGGSSSGGSSGSGGGSSSGGSGGGAFTQSHSTWYCGDACGMNDTGSCGTTYCGSQVDPTVLGAALSINRMNGPSGVYMGGGLCGKQIEIVALDTGRSITVPVIDACEACNADDHVDLTLGVWQQLGVDPCAGTFKQEWRFVN